MVMPIFHGTRFLSSRFGLGEGTVVLVLVLGSFPGRLLHARSGS